MTETNDKAVNNINARINEIKNVLRIVQNTFNLINDVDIKGAHAEPVAEIRGWLAGFGKTLQTQITALEATLPKEEVKETTPKEEVKAETPKLEVTA